MVSLGYRRYHTIINEKPLNEVMKEIKKDPNYVELKDVDKDFIRAILAVEDPDFYDHRGIKLGNIVDAFFTNMKEKEYVMGGSTITQQLSKNIYLDQKKEITRKVAELFFVHDLEESLSKDEILELYVNVIYYGDGYYGIEEAAQGYFNKSCDELSISQATILAGLPQAPTAYQLSDGFALAKQRQRSVLDAMVDTRVIKEDESNRIFNTPVFN